MNAVIDRSKISAEAFPEPPVAVDDGVLSRIKSIMDLRAEPPEGAELIKDGFLFRKEFITVLGGTGAGKLPD